ncbi:hypothetical protein Hanom_Chr08g00757561 [Helianthus anomalus]
MRVYRTYTNIQIYNITFNITIDNLFKFFNVCNEIIIHISCMQSTGSFFHDRSITLGNLMGVSSIVELSRRSLRRGKMLTQTLSLETKTKPNPKSKPWCFGFCLCLCHRDNNDVVEGSRNNIVPLGHFLEVERRAAQDHRRGQHSPLVYGADELTLAQPFRDSSNTLFVDGQIMPPTRSSPWPGLDANERRKSRGFITPCF